MGSSKQFLALWALCVASHTRYVTAAAPSTAMPRMALGVSRSTLARLVYPTGRVRQPTYTTLAHLM